MKPEALSWEPKRDGRRYCAPACGRGCTEVEYERAKANAAKLAKALGAGWEPLVWENLGWHWGASAPHIRVLGFMFKSRAPNKYSAWLHMAPEGSGGQQWTAESDDPCEAVRKVVSEARDDLDAIAAMLRAVDEVMP